MQCNLRHVVVLAFVLIAACDDGAGPDPVHVLQPVSGQDQVGGAGAALAQPIVVRLLGSNDRPISNAVVRWRTIEGGGSTSEDESVTGADGRATVEWTLGNDVGRQILLAATPTATLAIQATSTFQIVSVAAGFRHTCALASNGVAYCWGDNFNGQLGNSTAVASATPARVSTTARFILLAAGWSHTCGLSYIGEAFCWGDNSVGQAGLASGATRSAVPAPVAGADAFASLSTGFVHTCGIMLAGDGVCWGVNAQGQLGGAQGNRVRITGLQLRQVSAGEFHSCAVRTNDAALCWGWNSSGELGTGSADGAFVAAPTPVAGGFQFTRISAGVRHTCAIATNARAYCWGRNAVGETGQDPFVTVAIPTEVPGSETFTSIGTGNTHTCGLSGQRVLCWGSSPANGTASSTKLPTVVGNLQFASVAVGFDHTCGVASGAVWCWGSNSHGQLGQSGIAESIAPLRVLLPPD